MKQKQTYETMYDNLVTELSLEDIQLIRENRDWSEYDSLNVKEKKEMFINEARRILGDLTDFEKVPKSFKRISKEGLLTFGKFKGKNIKSVDTYYKLWAIDNVDGFEKELEDYDPSN